MEILTTHSNHKARQLGLLAGLFVLTVGRQNVRPAASC